MRRTCSTLLALILFSSTLAGCTGLQDDVELVPDEEVDINLDIPDSDTYQCFEFEGWERCWLTYFPENINLSTKSPIIFELHGWAASSFEMRNYTSITSLADQVGAIVIHPEGLAIPNSGAFGENQESWNAGVCCGDAKAQEINDAGFLIELN